MIIIKEGLTGKNPSDKVTYGGNVGLKMTGNANFPDGATVLAVLSGATDDLSKANEVGKASKIKIQVGNFNLAMKGVVLYAQGVILGIADDIAKDMAESAGLGTAKRGKPIIADLAAVNGAEKNTVILRKKVTTGKKHVAYIAQICTGDITVEANWTYCKFATVASVTIAGLTSGVRYYFRVAVVIGEEMSAYSAVVFVDVN